MASPSFQTVTMLTVPAVFTHPAEPPQCIPGKTGVLRPFAVSFKVQMPPAVVPVVVNVKAPATCVGGIRLVASKGIAAAKATRVGEFPAPDTSAGSWAA